MATNEPFVSVVTPVYNTADYLREAIESVLAQSYGNFEYIISDNCSTDGSSEIAHEYASLDNRVRVIDHADFLSQSGNYNRALRLISPAAKYCKMVQADDWIFPDCLREMIRVAEIDREIAIVGAYELAGPHVKCQGLTCSRPSEPCTIVPGREACRMYLLHKKYLFGTPTNLMYRADFVRSRDRFFREDRIHPDSDLCFELLGQYKFGFVHSVLSFSRVDNMSITGAMRDFEPDARDAYVFMRDYGRLHLTDGEYARCWPKAKKEYYDLLAYHMLRVRDKKFWEFHEESFRIADDRLNRGALLLLQLPRVLRWIGNPLSTLEGAARALTGRWRRRDAGLIEEARKKSEA